MEFQSTPSGWRVTFSEGDGCAVALFQSTPSGWRVTTRFMLQGCKCIFQSTPSGWRVTRQAPCIYASPSISIHTLRVEGDQLYNFCLCSQPIFQSTPSGWRVTCCMCLCFRCVQFQSTPSGWRVTLLPCKSVRLSRHFNPHPPGGG